MLAGPFWKKYKMVCFRAKSLLIFTVLGCPNKDNILHLFSLKTKLFSRRIFQADSHYRCKWIGVYPAGYKEAVPNLTLLTRSNSAMLRDHTGKSMQKWYGWLQSNGIMAIKLYFATGSSLTSESEMGNI